MPDETREPESTQPDPSVEGEPIGASDVLEEPESGRRRLSRAVFQPTRAQVMVAVLLALVGFAAVTQVRTNQVDDTYAALRQQDLIDVLNGLADRTQRAQAEIERLEDTRDELLSDTTARQTAIDQARQETQTLGILAGLIPVEGPGVRITIKEVGGPAEIGPFIDLVQAMRTAGAEAIVINGEVRVVAQTSFEDAEGGILVDGQMVTAPYVVEAIGNPVGLAEALEFPDGPEDQFGQDGIAELTYEKAELLQIQATRDLPDPVFAEPLPEQ